MRFDDDHPVEAVRGLRRPNKARTLRTVAQRVAWLTRKAQMRSLSGEDPGFQIDELKMLAHLVDIAAWPAVATSEEDASG